MQTPSLRLELADEAATDALGSHLAAIVLGSFDTLPEQACGGRIYLQGDLGAGKTSLVRAFLRACGVTGRIKSPSYALLESYKVSRLNLYHVDFYRFTDPKELADAGLRDLFQTDAIVLVEWPEKAAGQLPPPDLRIRLSPQGSGRLAEVEAETQRGAAWLNKFSLTSRQLPNAR